MKETFIIRTEWYEAIQELKPTEQAQIFKNLFHYHREEENLINLNNLQVKLVWRVIEPNLKRNIEAYDKRRETSIENGKLGGRPRKTNELEKPNNLTPKPNKPKEPNETLSVSVSVSDNIETGGVSADFKKFQDWILANTPQVAKMKEPFTEDQYRKAKEKFPIDLIIDILKGMHNTKPLLTKNVSAYLTLCNWADRRKEKSLTIVPRETPFNGTGSAPLKKLGPV